jgi:hypothetical protein
MTARTAGVSPRPRLAALALPEAKARLRVQGLAARLHLKLMIFVRAVERGLSDEVPYVWAYSAVS